MTVRQAFKGWVGRSRVAILLCLLVALGWQSYLTQTHFHVGHQRAGIASLESLRAAPGGDRHDPDSPLTCPICWEAALSGDYLAADPVVLAPPVIAVAWYITIAIRSARREQRSHAWQSRAPPHHSTPSTR